MVHWTLLSVTYFVDGTLDVVERDVLYGWYDWTLLSVTYFVDGTTGRC